MRLPNDAQTHLVRCVGSRKQSDSAEVEGYGRCEECLGAARQGLNGMNKDSNSENSIEIRTAPIVVEERLKFSIQFPEQYNRSVYSGRRCGIESGSTCFSCSAVIRDGCRCGKKEFCFVLGAVPFDGKMTAGRIRMPSSRASAVTTEPSSIPNVYAA